MFKSFQNENKSGLSVAIESSLYAPKGGKLFAKPKTTACDNFTVKIAETRQEKSDAFRLAYLSYLEKGFVNLNEREMLVFGFDAWEDSTIFIVLDSDQKVVGTATLVFDQGNRGIPADEIYADYLHDMRNEGKRFAEVSRLILDKSCRNSKEILVQLFNYLYLYSFYFQGIDGFVIQVNPRHVAYYQMLLSFDLIGDERPCAKVNNAPANLLYLPLKRSQSKIQDYSLLKVLPKRDRSLYISFMSPNEEIKTLEQMKLQNGSMSESDKFWFGLVEDDFIQFEDEINKQLVCNP